VVREQGGAEHILCRGRPLIVNKIAGTRSYRRHAISSHLVFQEPEMSHQKFEACIDACNDCADACDDCAASCLKEPDPKMMARCIALDMDCAQICRMAASYMARDSEFVDLICQACAEICDACADECAKHSMPHCQECAQACRRCADECRRMAATGHQGSPATTAGITAH
jgi:hypothetical protein